MGIAELGLATRLGTALAKGGVTTVRHVLDKLEGEGDRAMLAIKGFGPQGLTDLKRALSAKGFGFGQANEALGLGEVERSAGE